MYGDPATMSAKVIAAKNQHPNVPVICIQGDTASGSGPARRADIAIAISTLRQAGCKVVGYVATGYGTRLIADAMADITRWFAFYPIDGIFFDEVDGILGYYQQLTQLVMTHGSAMLSIGNPGTTSSQGSAFDFMITYENAGVPSLFSGNYIATGVPVLPALFPRPGWLLITDDPASYMVVPSYLAAEMAALDTGPAPPPPASTGTLTIT